MALDMAKYHKLFLEESTDHLGEISRALLDLEKDTAVGESIDVIFRMAHSIKSMAASLGYDPVSELSHRLEDRMEGVRTAGRVRNPQELGLLFQGLESLEAMVTAVSNEMDLVPADAGLLAELAADPDPGWAATPTADSPEAVGGEPKKVWS